jgi:hypothetical protein
MEKLNYDDENEEIYFDLHQTTENMKFFES